MTVLAEYLHRHGHTLEPLADQELLALSPGGGWRPAEVDPAISNVAVWDDPALVRQGFRPTILVSAARITPALDPEVVLDRLEDTAATLTYWRRRAGVRRIDDPRHVSDTLGEYSLGPLALSASTVASVWTVRDPTAGVYTALRQVVVTTFPNQVDAQRDALRAR